MKKFKLYSFIFLIPFFGYSQSDFNFFIEDGNIIWVKDSIFISSKSDIKSVLFERLESMDAIEIINSTRPSLIRAKMKRATLIKGFALGLPFHQTISGEIRIEVLSDNYYKIKLSSLVHHIDGGMEFPFEKQILKKKGSSFTNEKAQDLYNRKFLELFVVD